MQRDSAPGKGGQFSGFRLTNYWYAVCRAHSLRNRPLRVQLLGTPLVLLRQPTGEVTALLDRCPHRNVPLSLGRVLERGHLQCRYHGWEFGSDGSCVRVPGLERPILPKFGKVPCYAATEQAGLIWVYATPDVKPERPVPSIHETSTRRDYAHVLREVEVKASLHATLENALDVPHTAFLHRGLFRGSRSHRITAITKRFVDRVETEYVGEPRPTGIAATLLSPSHGTVRHWDRFVLPSIAEVEYRIGEESHFVVTAYGTPVDDDRTKLFALVHFRTTIPGWLLRPPLERIALRIFRQDARILALQSETVNRFGGERFTSSDLDVMGPQILRLLKLAEASELTRESEPYEKTIEFTA